MRVRSHGAPTQKDLESSELDEQKGYRMVCGSVGITATPMPGVWDISTTLLKDVRLAYRIPGRIPSIEESSRELYDILSEMSFLLGVLGQEEDDEDI